MTRSCGQGKTVAGGHLITGFNVSYGLSPQEPPSLVEKKRCTKMRVTSYLTYLTTSYLMQEVGEGGGGAEVKSWRT